MADLTTTFAGIQSPNPFWLASGPPTNTQDQVMRAFDAGWGGAVWKTIANPIVNVSSRLGSVNVGGASMVGLNNIELISDRPIADNLRELRAVKKAYPRHALIASLMVESKQEWKKLIRLAEDTGCDGLELNFGCPHGMCERGMGSAVGQEPKVLREITQWAVEFAHIPVLVKLSPNVTDILDAGVPAVEAGCAGLSLINTLKSLVGVDLDRLVPLPRVGDQSTHGGYCGPAVKPMALHMVGELARDPRITVPISGVGGVSGWRDAAEFMALGATSVQVCTAVMHYGFGIVEDMISGLSRYLDDKGFAGVGELVGAAVPRLVEWGDLDLNYQVVAEINARTCIGCQLCIPACEDGGHQCIYPPGVSAVKGHTAPMAEEAAKRLQVSREQAEGDGTGGGGRHKRLKVEDLYRVPWVDETDCIGCNLCQLVCPVDGCITMKELPQETAESWNDRVARGRDHVPGGLDDL